MFYVAQTEVFSPLNSGCSPLPSSKRRKRWKEKLTFLLLKWSINWCNSRCLDFFISSVSSSKPGSLDSLELWFCYSWFCFDLIFLVWGGPNFWSSMWDFLRCASEMLNTFFTCMQLMTLEFSLRARGHHLQFLKLLEEKRILNGWAEESSLETWGVRLNSEIGFKFIFHQKIVLYAELPWTGTNFVEW